MKPPEFDFIYLFYLSVFAYCEECKVYNEEYLELVFQENILFSMLEQNELLSC